MATYKHLRSSTANKRPTTSIADGQLAINTNTASPGLFFKDSAGTGIVKVGPVHVGTTAPNVSPAAGGSSGNYTGEQWLDTSVSPNQMKVWNGSAWVGIVADELPVSKLQDGTAGQIIQTDSAGTGVEWSSTTNLPIGSAGAPAYSFQSDSNTGIYSPGADQLAISTGGTGRLFVASDGKVGIGTSSPGYTLDVAGVISANATFRASNGTHVGIFGSEAFAAGVVGLGSGSNHPLVLGTNSIERLRIDSSGNVGIGTSSPSQTLHVENTNLVNPSLTWGASATQTIRVSGIRELALGVTGASPYDCYLQARNNANTAQALLLNPVGGNVGIGTSNPIRRLSVSNGGAEGIEFGPGQTSNVNYEIHYNRSTAAYITKQTEAAQHIFNNATAEVARIDSSGRLLVGTSTDTGGALLQVNDNRIRIATAKTPASATDTGSTGEICWDASYIYVCTATNTWKRTAITTW